MDVLEQIEKDKLMVSVNLGVMEEFDWREDERLSKELIKLAELGQRMQWVSVVDRLPEKDQLVLVAKGSWLNLRTFFIDGDGYPLWYDYVIGEGCEINEYTHWMPLPPNPGEGE